MGIAQSIVIVNLFLAAATRYLDSSLSTGNNGGTS